uniref:MORN repeat-containing protein 4 n=1 Tax=Magallana gigas TaxID=29159 RepID=K1PSZ0_MAGGI
MKGAYRYPDGSEYTGDWMEGQRHGYGVMKFPDGSQYFGIFDNGLCQGTGVMIFNDKSRYEGEFQNGKFNGYGVFTRSDGMKYEGEFKSGQICGYGLVTFADGSHGLPRNEGYFEGNKLMKREKCQGAVQRARQALEHAKSHQRCVAELQHLFTAFFRVASYMYDPECKS